MIISEEKFYDEYVPQKNHLDDNASFDGCMYETYGEELEYVFELSKKENRVWTIIEGDEGIVFSAGFHIVNRLGFLITEKPWNSVEDYVVDEDQIEDEPSIESAVETIHSSLVSYIEDCAGHGTEETEEIEKAWDVIKSKLLEKKGENKPVTGDMILNWHGSDHSIEELAETMAQILNGEYSIEGARQDVLDYEDEEEDEEGDE